MAGHSKWANIQHRKGAQDKKRAKMFAKLGREITVAAKIGLPDPDFNPRLRLAIANAKNNSMPNDRIARAIAAATSAADGSTDYEEIRYEGYGPGGVAVIVEALTDNRNRTASDVRTAFAKNGGNLGETGSVSFMFEKVGAITYPATAAGEDQMFEQAVEAGASNVEAQGETYEITTDPTDFMAVKEALEKVFGEPRSSALIWQPNVTTAVNEEQAETLFKMIEALEDLDDVQNVFANFDVSEEMLERLAG